MRVFFSVILLLPRLVVCARLFHLLVSMSVSSVLFRSWSAGTSAPNEGKYVGGGICRITTTFCLFISIINIHFQSLFVTYLVLSIVHSFLISIVVCLQIEAFSHGVHLFMICIVPQQIVGVSNIWTTSLAPPLYSLYTYHFHSDRESTRLRIHAVDLLIETNIICDLA